MIAPGGSGIPRFAFPQHRSTIYCSTMVDALMNYLHTPKWKRQHRWRRAVWTAMNTVGLTGMHALPLNKRWIDIHRRLMPFPNLDPGLMGFRIVQISDLHYSPVVWKRYLEQMLQWVHELEPDLVVVTGDLITGGYRYAPRIAKMLAGLKPPHGVICTFGNHDYSMYGKKQLIEGMRRADYLEKCLMNEGLIVLRNEVLEIRPGKRTDRPLDTDGDVTNARPLMIVGLDDEWSGAIDPRKAFAGVGGDLPVLCLNHNPANCHELLEYPWQWMLAGHTHGRQTADSRVARTFSKRREYTHGYYAIQGRHLYVNRGLSYGQRVKHWCRPEMTVFRLTAEAPQEA